MKKKVSLNAQWVLNPLTGRMIKKDGRLYKHLVRCNLIKVAHITIEPKQYKYRLIDLGEEAKDVQEDVQEVPKRENNLLNLSPKDLV